MSDKDTIYRQAAIDAMAEMYHAAEKWGQEATDDVIKARAESCMASLVEMKLRTEQLPSAQPEQRWIPCSERLPIARQSVILSTKEWTGEGCYWETTEHHVIWKGYKWNATYWDDEVIAWMPLPKTYAERREDEGDRR